MQTLKRLTLTAIVGFGIGAIPAHAEDTQASDDVLMQALRKKQAELSTSGVSSTAKPAAVQKQNEALQKASAKKQKADREAKIAAERKIQSDEITAQKIKAKEEAKKKLQPQPVTPVKTAPVAESTESDAVMVALRKKQAELATSENSPKPVVKAPAVVPASAPAATPVVVPATAPVATPAAAPVVAVSASQTDEVMAALRKKQAELAASENSPKPVVATPAVAPVSTPKATPVATATVAAPVAAASTSQTDEVMVALRKKQAELVTQDPVPAKPLSREEKKKQKEQAELQAAMDKAIADKQKREAARAAELAKKPAKETPVKAAPEVVLIKSKKVVPAEQAPAVADKKQTVVPPLSKDQRLAELLRRYKADEISPRDYHTERAKILAEP